jgi:RND family efflux transporter MFP subunit
MDDKAGLLNQLKIDRGPARVRSGPGLGLWLGGIAAIFVVVAVGAWLLAPKGLPVHAAPVKASTDAGGAAVAGTLLDASGYVVAQRQATVSGKSIYKVQQMLVEEGQHVRKGDVIARLDDSNAKAALDQSKAQAAQAQAALAAAKIANADARPIYVRNQKQLAEGLISQDAFDAAQATYHATQTALAVAERNAAAAQAGVGVNQRYEDDTTVRTPFDGVVTVKNAQPGDIVSPQFQGGGGLATIVDMSSLEVQVDVSENYISRVHAGQRAQIKLNAYPDWVIPAHVIAVIPTADQTKATVKVRVAFEQKDDRVLPQMGARVAFLEDAKPASPTESKASVLIAPTEAVIRKGDIGTVFIIDDGRVQRRAVRLGAQTAEGQIVLSGLQPGLMLAVGDLTKLSDGVRVHIVKSPPSP